MNGFLVVAVTEMRDHRGRRQNAEQVRAQPVRVTIEDEDDFRNQFSRSCSVNERRRGSNNSPRISISGESGEHRLFRSSSEDDDLITEDRRSSLVPLCESFI